MKSRCEWPSLLSRPPARGTSVGVFALLPVPHPQAPASPADPAGDLLAKLGALGGLEGSRRRARLLGAPWGWARLLWRAGEGCASQCRASWPFANLTAIRRQRDILMCQRNSKPLPTPSRVPPASSLPSLSLAPPACPGTYPVLPPKPPTTLCAGMRALPEIFPLIALARRDGGLPSSSWCKTLPYSTSVYQRRSAGSSRGRQTPQS